MPQPNELAALLAGVEHFKQILDATTIPLEKGDRRVAGVGHAVELSQSSDALQMQIIDFNRTLGDRYGQATRGYTPGISLAQRDTEDEPWTDVPPEDVPGVMMLIGAGGADPALVAAIDSVFRMTAFSVPPGGTIDLHNIPRQRWSVGDIVSCDQVAHLNLAIALLRLRTATSPAQTPRATQLLELPLDACLSSADLAGLFEIEPEALRKRLDRWRRDHDDGYIETSDRRSRDPKYYYKLGHVLPVIREVKSSGMASGERPSAKKT